MIRDTIMLGLLSFVGTLFWPFNPDAALLLYIGALERSALLGILVSFLAQAGMLVLLVFVGHLLRRRWAWLDRRCEQVERRWGARLVARTPWVAASCGFFGVPPGAVTVLLGSALNVPARRILPVLFLGRLLWLLVLAQFGHVIAGGSPP